MLLNKKNKMYNKNHNQVLLGKGFMGKELGKQYDSVFLLDSEIAEY